MKHLSASRTRFRGSFKTKQENPDEPILLGLHRERQTSLDERIVRRGRRHPTEPVEVRRSKRDPSVHLYYGNIEGDLLLHRGQIPKCGRLRDYGLSD